GRSLNSQVVSSTVFHSVASCGMSFRSGSRVVRQSKILNETVMSLTALLICGSKALTSALVATTRSLFSWAAWTTGGGAADWLPGVVCAAATWLAAGADGGSVPAGWVGG